MIEAIFLWALVSLVNVAVFGWLYEQTQAPAWAFLFFCWLSVFVPPLSCFAAFAVYRDAMKGSCAIHCECKKGSAYLESL